MAKKGKVFNYRNKVSDKEIDAGYKKQRDSYPKAGDSSPAPVGVIRPRKKKRRM